MEVRTVETSEVGSVTVVKPGPSLTFDDGNLGLRRTIGLRVDGGARAFVVNMGAVGAIDSYGVAELVSCHTTMTRSGGRVILCALSPKVREVLAVTRLDTVFAVRESEAAAVAELRQIEQTM